MDKQSKNKRCAKIIIISIFFVGASFLAIPTVVSAGLTSALQKATGINDPIVFQPQVGIPGLVDKGSKLALTQNSTSYIAQMVKGFYDYGLGIGIILAAVVMMAAGVIWLTSGGSSEKITQAKGLISGSLIGMLLLIGSWMLLNIINPYLVNFKIKTIKNIAATDVAKGCCLAQETILGQKTNVASLVDSQKKCTGTWYGYNYAPDANTASPHICETMGCCSAVINVMGGHIITSSRTISFPSSKKNCEGADFESAVPGSDIIYSWNDKKCEISEVKDCAGLADGTKCFDRSDGTIAGVFINSTCSSNGTCGYCYGELCLPKLGEIGQICGGDNNTTGICMKGTLANRCPEHGYKHISGGRDCNKGYCCARTFY